MTTTALDSFPETHEAQYKVLANRMDGERTLGSIAAGSSREYVWTFAEKHDLWKNHEVDHFLTERRRMGKLRGQRHEATIPDELLFPDNPDTSIYHNHPPAPVSFEYPEIKSQLPSNEDITACINLCMNGYRDFRIATALGITVLTLSSSAIKKEGVDIQGFSLKRKRMRKWEENLGTIGAIHQATNFFTEGFNDQVIVDFRPFPDSQKS